MVLRGIGVYAGFISLVGVILWDIISFESPPTTSEWILLFVVANVAWLIIGTYAFYVSFFRHWMSKKAAVGRSKTR